MPGEGQRELTYTFPMKLTAKVSLSGRRLVVQANDAVFGISIASEAAEWIWEEVLGGGDRKDARVIVESSVSLTDKGVAVFIGGGPTKYPLFRTLDGRARGILADRQAAVNAGTPMLWKPVQL
jgi:hypothetical protein